MIELTEAAQQRLDRYLRELRATLKGVPSIDPDEVERDVLEHIEKALSGIKGPVSERDLQTVLEGLGSPQQWLPPEEWTRWRRFRVALETLPDRTRETFARMRSSPVDHRLAYLSFGGLVAAALLAAMMKPGREEDLVMPAILVLASFVCARAAIAGVPAAEIPPSKKWLVYPVLIPIYLALLAVIVLLPLPFAILLSDPVSEMLGDAYRHTTIRFSQFGVAMWLVPMVVGLWWTILGFVWWRRPQWVRALFHPFVDHYTGRQGLALAVFGLVVFLVCLGIGATLLRPILSNLPAS